MGFELKDLLHGDLQAVIEAIGYLGVYTIVFIESGLLVGFFLPGDSLLFTAGFLASQDFFDIKLLAAGCFIAAVAGDSVGYFIGHHFGRRIFNKENSFFFNKDHLVKAEKFYERHGGKTIILARFMPVIRTFVPVVAGIGKMKYPSFVIYNIIGGFLWAVCITLAGFFLGSVTPNVDKFLLPIVLLIILLSISPALYHSLKEPKHRTNLLQLLHLKK